VKQFGRLLAELFSRQWWWVTLLILAAMMVLARLGFWQLDRLQQRRAANAVLSATLAASPLDLSGSKTLTYSTGLKNRQAMATGAYDFDRQIILIVQNWQGRAGVHLITPLVFADGETAVLVDRGWIPEADNNPAGYAKYDVPGPVTIEGFVALSQALPGGSETAPLQSGGSETTPLQKDWYRVDVAAIGRQMPYDLLPFFVLQAAEDNSQLPFRTDPEIDLSEGSHLGYAFQWFVFSLGLGIGYGLYVRKNMKENDST
jgi:surfeit locus 1 family protein